ncbi:MAG TPA: hypothetical protein VGI87_06350 [Solirubrobacteraceae bacterium]
MARSWILTCSPKNVAATRAHGFSVIGFKDRNRRRAGRIEPGDRIVLYATGVMAFAGSIRVEGEMFCDDSRIWAWRPEGPDPYPWRFPTSPEYVLDEDEWIPAVTFVDQLDHIQKWPRAHWTLAFQGQVRPVSAHDGQVLADRLAAAAALTSRGGARTRSTRS